jgi:hypothetical protein
MKGHYFEFKKDIRDERVKIKINREIVIQCQQKVEFCDK